MDSYLNNQYVRPTQYVDYYRQARPVSNLHSVRLLEQQP
jgi:hypothetical protein